MTTGGNLVKILERLGQGGVCLDVDPIVLIKTRNNRGFGTFVRQIEPESYVAKRVPVVGRAREKHIGIPDPTRRLCRLPLKGQPQPIQRSSDGNIQIEVRPDPLQRKR